MPVREAQGWTRIVRAAAVAAAIGVVLTSIVLPATGAAAEKGSEKETPKVPSYVIPNIIAGGMCLIVLAIACRRPRKT
jgi:hypothetical protein